MAVAVESVILIVDVLGVSVKLAEDTFQTFPVPDNVHVPEPMVMALVKPELLPTVPEVTEKLFALNVPLATVKPIKLVPLKASCST